MTTMLRRTVIVLALIAACAACSGGGGPSAAAKSAFIDGRAAALCAVRGHKFANEQAQEAAYRSAVDHVALSASDRTALGHQFEKDAALRAAVTDRVARLCP